MAYTPFIFTICACTLLVASTTARHIHRPQLHQHQRRQAVTVTAFETSSLTEEVAAASITAGNDAIADIQQIQAGLSNLPADLLSFVQSVEARLGDVESMLSALVGSTAMLSASSTALTPESQSSTLFTSTTTPAGRTSYSSQRSSLSVSSSQSSSSTNTSYNTTTITSRITSTRVHTITITSRITSTRVHTITIPKPTSTSSMSRGLPSSTFAGPGNWTLPDFTSGRPAVAPGGSATRTVILAPAPTAWEPRK